MLRRSRPRAERTDRTERAARDPLSLVDASPSGPPVPFTFDGRPMTALPGQSLAAALWAAGILAWRTTRVGGRPRGVFCGIGQCFDCLVTVNGRPGRRACLVPAAPGDVVTTQEGHGRADLDTP
ncbi:(2Fe-2S)-binding protein [Streptomyces sp. P9(2023)]|uniref:(2Fe-2S)-binding protein n=1 Tax=Streptomyces sp. P9(2023) TaxID=3064394 RepID=UPI0028F3FA2E|nr:(2Fe-2S)-binding protein [Streptomyces sp. P9(2023)]MDT9689007.1 (2Fe-2S)-binding protein [Streptomyces sp. P9(2023)]